MNSLRSRWNKLFSFLLLCTSLTGNLSAMASDGYSLADVTSALETYFTQEEAMDPLTRKIHLDDIAVAISIMKPTNHNAAVTLLLSNYQLHPELRDAIAQLLPLLRTKVNTELRDQRTHHWIDSVMTGMALSMTVGLSVGIGRGVYALTLEELPADLRRIEKIRIAVQIVRSRLPTQSRDLVLLTDLGIAAGLTAEAYYHALETRKADPEDTLELMQKQILSELSQRALALQTQVCEGKSLTQRGSWLAQFQEIEKEIPHFERFALAQKSALVLDIQNSVASSKRCLETRAKRR